MEKSTWAGIGIFLIIVVGGSLLMNSGGLTGSTVEENNQVKHIVIDAKWYEFSPNTIRIKEGDKVMLMINNLDTTHGITIPELGVSGNDVVEFTATKKGEFDFYCNNFCGPDHRDMIGKIIVE